MSLFVVNLGVVGTTGQGNEKHAQGAFERVSSRFKERRLKGPRPGQIPVTGEPSLLLKYYGSRVKFGRKNRCYSTLC